MSDDVTVEGGRHSPVGRIQVDLEAMRVLAGVCAGVQRALDGLGDALRSTAWHAQGELAATSALSPRTAVEAEAALAGALLQTRGVGMDVGLLAQHLSTAGEAYADSERRSAGLWRVREALVDAVEAPRGVVDALRSIIASDPTLTDYATRYGFALTTHLSPEAADLHGGVQPFPAWSDTLAVLQSKGLPALNQWVGTHGEETSRIVDGASVGALAVLGLVDRDGLLRAAVTNRPPGAQALLLGYVAQRVPLFEEGQAVVGPPRRLGPRASATSLRALVTGLDPSLLGEKDPPPGRVDVVKRTWTDPSGRERASYVVALPGTSSWSAGSDHPDVRDLTGNIRGRAGLPTAETKVLAEALTRAGVPPGAQVALVGHSQGGMTAINATRDPEMGKRFHVTHVITAGSPSSELSPAPGVRYLGLENRFDPVHALDGRRTPTDKDHLIVRFDGDASRLGTDGHAIGEYVEGARRVDALVDDARAGRDPADGARSAAEFADDLRAHGYLSDGTARNEATTATRVDLTRVAAPADQGESGAPSPWSVAIAGGSR